jgi:hypothetical protein
VPHLLEGPRTINKKATESRKKEKTLYEMEWIVIGSRAALFHIPQMKNVINGMSVTLVLKRLVSLFFITDARCASCISRIVQSLSRVVSVTHVLCHQSSESKPCPSPKFLYLLSFVLLSFIEMK